MESSVEALAVALAAFIDQRVEARVTAAVASISGGSLTTEQAAERLDRKPKTVRRLIAMGKLRATLRGNRWRISEADLSAFVDNKSSAPEDLEKLQPVERRILASLKGGRA